MTTLPETLQLALTPGAIVPVDVETTSALLAALRQLHEENKELREAAQQALEALEFLSLDFMMLDLISPGREAGYKAITALRERLEETK